MIWPKHLCAIPLVVCVWLTPALAVDAGGAPIEIKCPSDNGGILEVISLDKKGGSFRMRAWMENAEATSVGLSYGDRKLMFEKEDMVDLRKNAATFTKREQRWSSLSNDMNQKVCLGTAQDRARAENMLKANRKMLGLE